MVKSDEFYKFVQYLLYSDNDGEPIKIIRVHCINQFFGRNSNTGLILQALSEIGIKAKRYERVEYDRIFATIDLSKTSDKIEYPYLNEWFIENHPEFNTEYERISKEEQLFADEEFVKHKRGECSCIPIVGKYIGGNGHCPTIGKYLGGNGDCSI